MGNRRKENELREKVTWFVNSSFVYLKWVSAMWCIGVPLFLIYAWCW